MTLIGLQTYLAFKIKFLLPNKKFFFISFLLGLIIPEVDITIIFIYNLLLSAENTIPLFDKNFTHSVLTLSVIYLIFLVIYEIKKNKEILNIGNAIILGMGANIILDLLFRFGNIDIFWPLPIGVINSWDYSTLTLSILMGLEFISFRLIASQLIKTILNKPSETEEDGFIKYLSYWMKFELLFFIVFTFIVLYKSSFQLTLFAILYIISYLMLIFSLFKLRKNIV